jgi:hypothetical protein
MVGVVRQLRRMLRPDPVFRQRPGRAGGNGVLVDAEVVSVGVGNETRGAGLAAVEVKLDAAKLKIVCPLQHGGKILGAGLICRLDRCRHQARY